MNTENAFVIVDPLEQSLRKEIEREQISHPPLSEYQVGSARYERLYLAMSEAQRFQFPSTMEFNV